MTVHSHSGRGESRARQPLSKQAIWRLWGELAPTGNARLYIPQGWNFIPLV